MARSPALNQRLRDQRREQILSAALHLFAEQGLAATRIAAIARAAGVAQGLLYHYFPSKEAIYVELIRHAHDSMGEAARALERLPLAPHEKIDHALRELLGLLEASDDAARYFLLVAQAGLSSAIPPAAAQVIRRQRAGPYRSIARILRAGQAEGTVHPHDADALAVLFWVAIKGLALHRAALGRAYRSPDPALLSVLFLREVPHAPVPGRPPAPRAAAPRDPPRARRARR